MLHIVRVLDTNLCVGKFVGAMIFGNIRGRRFTLAAQTGWRHRRGLAVVKVIGFTRQILPSASFEIRDDTIFYVKTYNFNH